MRSRYPNPASKKWLFWVFLICAVIVMARIVLYLHTKNQRVADMYLSLALANKQPGQVAEWLNRGANPNKADQDGRRPLHKAASLGSIDMAKSLLEHGAEINGEDNEGVTPLLLAADNMELAEYLIGEGADPKHEDRYGRSAVEFIANRRGGSSFHLIYSHDDSEVEIDKRLLQFWLTKGARYTPHAAARLDDIEGLRKLLAAGADPNEAFFDNETALHVAVIRGNLDAMALLLDNGADPEIRLVRVRDDGWKMDGDGGNALYLVFRTHLSNRYELARALVQGGADVNVLLAPAVTGQRGSPCEYNAAYPIYAAAEMRDPKYVRLFIEAGADPNGLLLLPLAPGISRETPLDSIRKKNPNSDSIRLLVEAGGKTSSELRKIWGKSTILTSLNSDTRETIRQVSAYVEKAGGPEVPDPSPDKLQEWKAHARKAVIWLGRVDEQKAKDLEAGYTHYLSRRITAECDD